MSVCLCWHLFPSCPLRWQQGVPTVWRWPGWARQAREWWPSMETLKTPPSQTCSRRPSLSATSSASLLNRTWYTIFQSSQGDVNAISSIAVKLQKSNMINFNLWKRDKFGSLHYHNLFQIGLICYYSFSSMIIPFSHCCLSPVTSWHAPQCWCLWLMPFACCCR